MDKKKELIETFATKAYDGDDSVFAEDAIVQPPYAPPFPYKVFLGMLAEYKKALPDWGGVYTIVEECADGSVKAKSQQRFGLLQGDLPALGPFPAVAFSEATDRCKTTPTIFPFEHMTFTFSADGSKITSAIWDTAPTDETVSIAEMADCNTTDVPPMGGFGCLYAVMLGKPVGPPPSLVPHP